MVFQCQRDSFLKEFTSKVISIEKLDQPNEYNVILEDTILFPEGGGQPCDHGYLNKEPVVNVVRKGSEAIHVVKSEKPAFEIGDVVVQKIDWERRFDHMQQHSGQHLISATFEREFNFETKSWWLGVDSSYIELGVNDVTPEHLDRVEKIVNQYIAAHIPVTVQTIAEGDPITEESARASRGLPKDHVGDIRVITIEGVDSNLCCGTHVNNLSELQMIKLLHVEKTKSKLWVHFLVGNRVLKKLHDSYKQELEMNLLLKGGFASHIELLKKMQLNMKASQRTLQRLIKEIAIDEAQKFTAIATKPKYYFVHRLDGNDGSDYISIFLRNIPVAQQNETFFFITVGDESTGKGQMLLNGSPDVIKELGEKICSLLDGKGNGKNNKFQAKINSLKKINECEKLIIDYFDK